MTDDQDTAAAPGTAVPAQVLIAPSRPQAPTATETAPLPLSDREDELAGAVSELATLLVDEEDLSTTLHRVADLAVRVIPGCTAAGVTLIDDGRAQTAAYTDERTLLVDRGQYDAGDGPCLTAARERRIVRSDSADAAQEWPEFWRDAAAADIHSFLAAPLIVPAVAELGDGRESIGALNLYAGGSHAFATVDEALVTLFAGQASVALANARLYSRAVTLAAQLRTAMESRAIIEQAKGVVMSRQHIDADAAFDLLRTVSMRRNRKLRDVAREVVDSTAP